MTNMIVSTTKMMTML